MRGSRPALVGVLLGALALPAAAAPHSILSGPSGAPVPGSSCQVFPSDNVWNLDISRLPVNAKNAMWKAAMHAGSTNLHPDFGPPRYGIPFDVVGSSHPRVHVRFTYRSESDPGPYPFGGDTTIEGGSDRHAIMIDRDRCRLFELFAARWDQGRPRAGSGAIFDLGSNALRHRGWTSADAAGLPIFPGLVRWDEVRAGRISHAIRFTADCTSRRFLWPARHQAGSSDRRCPPMGARFRLKRGFALKGAGRDAKVILAAMKRYGLILADNGSDWFFQGAVNAHWKNGLLDQLKRIPARAFVAVDESACRVRPNSGAAAAGPRCPVPHRARPPTGPLLSRPRA
jgi:hypothetical protein